MNALPGWLDSARYLSLATMRKDGREVRTPVWFARLGDALVLFSAGDAGKVKRLRHTRDCRIAQCDMRGRLAGGEAGARWLAVQGEFVNDASDVDAAHRALRAKYGWQMLLADLGARFSGRIGARRYIRLRPGRALGDGARITS
jgi:PPOX class probable F420-dependent enzyme